MKLFLLPILLASILFVNNYVLPDVNIKIQEKIVGKEIAQKLIMLKNAYIEIYTDSNIVNPANIDELISTSKTNHILPSNFTKTTSLSTDVSFSVNNKILTFIVDLNSDNMIRDSFVSYLSTTDKAILVTSIGNTYTITMPMLSSLNEVVTLGSLINAGVISSITQEEFEQIDTSTLNNGDIFYVQDGDNVVMKMYDSDSGDFIEVGSVSASSTIVTSIYFKLNEDGIFEIYYDIAGFNFSYINSVFSTSNESL